jgi:hypothetical protein
MARRSARRTYVRDGRGRFASTGTTTAKAKPAARRAQRGTNRITRDNSGKITGVGKSGATARGGRIRTAAGNQRGAVLERVKKRQSPSGAIRRTDINKARIHNTVSKMAEKRNKSGLNNPVRKIEDNAARLKAASKRIAGQNRAKPAAPVKPAKAPRAGKVKGPSKGERVLARIAQNFARASAESRSKKEERKLARTAAVAEMAQGRVSRLAVGKRDPAQQYTRAELLPQLNKSLKRPIPKRERKSTLNPDFTRGLRGIAQGGMTKLRAAARKQGKLTGSRAPKQLRSARTAGTVRKPKGYAPPKAAQAKVQPPKPTSRRMLRIKASGPAGKYKGAWNMPDFAKGPRSAGTVRRPKGYSPPKPQATSISSSVRNRAASAQRRRRNSILDRTRGTIGRRGRNSKENPRIRAVDTGMRQLALVGKPKKLKRYKPVK